MAINFSSITKIWWTLLPLISALLCLTCALNPPSAPSWETSLTIPLTNEAFTMAEIVEDEKYLKADSTGAVFFEFEKEIDRFSVGERLKIDATSENFYSELGKFTVSAPGQQTADLALSNIYPEAVNLDGQEVIVPPFSLEPYTQEIPPFENFDWVRVDSGLATLTLVNNLAIYLGSPLRLTLIDATTDTVIEEIQHQGEVAPGDSISYDVPLSGRRIPNSFSVRVSGESTGSHGEQVYVDANSSLLLRADIGKLKVSEAYAVIPDQSFTQEDSIVIEDSVVITEAYIKRGSIELDVSSSLPLDATLSIEIPDFISSNGESLKDSLVVHASSQVSQTINLDDYVLKPELRKMGEQTLRFIWSCKTGSKGEKVYLHSKDYLSAGFYLSEVVFSQISGIIDSITVEIDPISKEIDFSTEMDSIFLENAQLELTLNHGINFPVKSHLIIEGHDGAGAVVDLIVDEEIQAAPFGGIHDTTIILNKNNSNIVDFLNTFPTQIEISGNMTLGDENWEGTVTENDFVEGSVKMSAPLALSLAPQTVETEVNKLEIEEDAREQIKDNLMAGKLVANFSNHLPLGASVTIHISKVDSTAFTQPDLVIGPLTLEAGLVDSQTGRVVQPVLSKVEVSLNKDELSIFGESPLFTGTKILFPGTNGQVIRVVDSDFLKISAYCTVKFKVDFEDAKKN